jgi:hypothetical protein
MGVLQNNPVVEDIAWALAFGTISDGTTISGRAQGYTATSATTGKAIRATTYTPQGANAQRSVSSSNAADSSAGTGAQQITINYLDASVALHSEIVTMNGTTAVNTVGTNYAFIENMIVSQVGTQGGGNTGAISLFTATAGGGTAWASIAASDGMTFYAHHYVPAGVSCYLLSMTCGGTIVAGQTNLNHSGNPTSTNSPQLQIGMTLVHLAGSSFDHDFEVPLALPGPDLVWLVERPTAATASTAVAGFEYVQG